MILAFEIAWNYFLGSSKMIHRHHHCWIYFILHRMNSPVNISSSATRSIEACPFDNISNRASTDLTDKPEVRNEPGQFLRCPAQRRPLCHKAYKIKAYMWLAYDSHLCILPQSRQARRPANSLELICLWTLLWSDPLSLSNVEKVWVTVGRS